MKNFWKLILAVALCEAVGIAGAFFTSPAVSSTWYASLAKPSFQPPSWLFSPVWILLYVLMGTALYLVRKNRGVVILFLIHLFFNGLWSILFFGLKSPFYALLDIAVLWILILVLFFKFSKIRKAAGWLLLPYLLWVSFAGFLNYSIWQLQTSAVGPVACTMEAKLCPDGSYVARTGPSCEFAPCPKEDLIQAESPRANGVISSPLVVKGKARGSWFFEARFPVILTDWDGRIIAQVPAQAKDTWMTEEFVEFEAVLEFEKPAIIGDFAKRGALILKKDNPSGLPQNDDAMEIPIFFE